MKNLRVRRSRKGIGLVAVALIAMVVALIVAWLMQAGNVFSVTFNTTLDAMTQNLQNPPPDAPTSDASPTADPLSPTGDVTPSIPPPPADDLPGRTPDDGPGDAPAGPGADDPANGNDTGPGANEIPRPPAGGGYTYSDDDNIIQIFIVDAAGRNPQDITETLRQQGVDPTSFQMILKQLEPRPQAPVSPEQLENSGKLDDVTGAAAP